MKKYIRNLSVSNRRYMKTVFLGAASVPLLVGGVITDAQATAPCGDFGECKVLVEINSTDGDIGFHWLTDGDDLNSTRIDDPNGQEVFSNKASGPLLDQKLTETFGESAEPVCKEALKEDPDDEVVTIRDFEERWDAGTYGISGEGDEGENLSGETELTYYLPAAPVNLAFDVMTGVITWDAGDDLGECADFSEVQDLVNEGVLAALPGDVDVLAWEIVAEPDVDDGDAKGSLKFSTRVAGDIETKEVTVPSEYLASLGEDTPVKIEIGAIGGLFEIDEDGLVVGDDDNATFAEEDGFCVNETEAGCDDEE